MSGLDLYDAHMADDAGLALGGCRVGPDEPTHRRFACGAELLATPQESR